MYQTSLLFRKVINSLSWSFVSSIYRLFANFAILVVLSRILDPRDFGIINYSIVIFNSIFLILTESVGQSYLIKKKFEEDLKTYNTSLFYLFIFASLIYVIIGIINYIFYPNLWFTSLQIILYISFLIRLPSIIFEFDFIKQKKFKLLSIIDLITLSIYMCLAIVLANFKFGYYSLILATSGLYLSKSALLIYINSKKIFKVLPSQRFGIANIKSPFKFLKTNYATFLYDNIEKIILPIITSLPFLGYYSRAYAINNVPLSIINKPVDHVIYSYLSDKENFKDKLSSYFENFIIIASLIVIPMSLFVFLYAEEIVFLLLGENWASSAIILKYISPLIFFLYLTKCFEPIYKASDFIEIRTKILIFFILLKLIIFFLFIQEEQLIRFAIILTLIHFCYLVTLIYKFLKKMNYSILKFLNFFKQNSLFILLFITTNFFIKDINFYYILFINISIYVISIFYFKFLLSKKTNLILSDFFKL